MERAILYISLLSDTMCMCVTWDLDQSEDSGSAWLTDRAQDAALERLPEGCRGAPSGPLLQKAGSEPLF